MSATLPVVSSKPKQVGSADLIEQLLAEQQSLTAVEAFSRVHDANADAEPEQARYYKKLLPATPPGPDQQYSFEVDLDQCSGCKACVVACHTLNGLEEDESWRRVGTITIGEELPRVQHVTTACHHCEDPGCLNGCPVKAYNKDPNTGIVRHLDDQCIGCKYCTMMCPYEVPQYSDRLGIVRKCDMCHQRLSVGEAPACVQSCPNEAISIKIVDVGNTYDDATSLAAGAPSSSITSPTTVYRSAIADLATKGTPQDEHVDHVAESHWPLALMLVATQISVGILLAERIVATLIVSLGGEVAAETTRWSSTAALIIAGIGMAIAPLHLGQPFRAWRVFLGLRTSWLSREAVVLGKYMGLLLGAVALLWLPVFADKLPESITGLIPTWAAKATLGLALLVGIAGLISSAMIYVATKRTLWRTSRTFTRFLGTGAVVGTAWLIPVLWISEASTGMATLVTAVAIAGLLAKLSWEQKLQDASIRSADEYDVRSSRLIAGPLAAMSKMRTLTATLGVGLLLFAWLVAFGSSEMAAIVALPAVVAITAGEFLERLLYFQSVVYDRMPGTLT